MIHSGIDGDWMVLNHFLSESFTTSQQCSLAGGATDRQPITGELIHHLEDFFKVDRKHDIVANMQCAMISKSYKL